jgi:hypothetical protein
MQIQEAVRQLRPRVQLERPLDKVQNFVSEAAGKLPQEKVINVDALVSAEKAVVATEMYEAAATMVGMEGVPLTKAKMTKVMGHPEFSPTAKKWIDGFFQAHPNEEAVDAFLNWAVLIGGAIVDVHGGLFKDFIHKNIKQYYDNAPISFQVPTGEKPNTADVVLVVSGSRSDVINSFKQISKLSERDQSARLRTDKKGMVTLLDERGRESVSFYQISLKKGMEVARIGRATTFINKNYAGGVSLGSPTQADSFYTGEVQTESFFSDAMFKFKDVVSSGFKNFVSWVKQRYTKIAQVIVGVAVKLSNQMIKRDRGMRAITNVVSTTRLTESNLTTFLGEKKSPNITVTNTLLKEFQTIQNEFIKKDKINQVHRDNVALLEKLNSSFSAPDRKVPPILMLPNSNAGILNMTEVANAVEFVLNTKEGDIITKSDIFVALKIGMNFSANVAIFAILKSVERNISQYENLSQALFAFAAEIESETKFGNTALPLVVVYGGEDKKAVVLGTRDEFKQDKVKELTAKGRDYNDFPVAIISVRKAKSGKVEQLYNVIHFKIVTDFKEVGGKPEPVYLMFELIADQSRSFTLKVEGNKYQDKAKAMS